MQASLYVRGIETLNGIWIALPTIYTSREVSQLPKTTSSFLPQNESIHDNDISAEGNFTGFVQEHNLPLDVADHLVLYSVPCFLPDGATTKTIQNIKHLTTFDLLFISSFIYTVCDVKSNGSQVLNIGK